jgi:hypothetical protein
MRTLQWALAGLVVGVILAAFRDFERGRWLTPVLQGVEEVPPSEEPVLGYDGMDQESLLDWLDRANLDELTIRKILRYEGANLRREPVLATLEERMR